MKTHLSSGGAASSVSVANALIRGFGVGMMHGACTLAVGYGMTFVHTIGFLLPVITFIPVLVLLGKTEEKKPDKTK